MIVACPGGHDPLTDRRVENIANCTLRIFATLASRANYGRLA